MREDDLEFVEQALRMIREPGNPRPYSPTWEEYQAGCRRLLGRACDLCRGYGQTEQGPCLLCGGAGVKR